MKNEFIARYASEYGYDGQIDTIYEREISPRMKSASYLDYTGSSLYGTSQMHAIFEDLNTHLFGNPHSANPSSKLTEQLIENAREQLLTFFGTDSSSYQVIFTRGATDALKLIGEAFPWKKGSEFVYLRENHNSVLGIREYALRLGSNYHSIAEQNVYDWIDASTSQQCSTGRYRNRPPSRISHHQYDCNNLACSSFKTDDTIITGLTKSYHRDHASVEFLQDSTDYANSDAYDRCCCATEDKTDAKRLDDDDDNFEDVYHLFAFPAEDNFAGVKYDMGWIKGIQQKTTKYAHTSDNDVPPLDTTDCEPPERRTGTKKHASDASISDHRTRHQRTAATRPRHHWKVLLDAAAFVPTQQLNLSNTPADFVTLSFYKMFGYPTGLGALILRSDVAEILAKPFWGGGAVSLSTSYCNFRVLKSRPPDRFEDGTVPFLDIIALKYGFAALDAVGGMQRIQLHVAALTEYLFEEITALRHSNNRSIVTVYGKHHHAEMRDVQGGIINFNVLDDKGYPIGYKRVQIDAARAGIHVRSGIMCNPGAAYWNLGLTEDEIKE
eukprot:gene5457-6614_t